EPAGLVTRRHEKQIAARLDTVGERLVEADAHADAIGVTLGQSAEAVFQAAIARAEHHQTDAEAQRVVGDAEQDVAALLRAETRDHAGERGVERDLQTHLRDQRLLADALAAERARAVARGPVPA